MFPERVKRDWKMRCVSAIQSCILGPGSLCIVFQAWAYGIPHTRVDRIYSTNHEE